jgi:hypothetical protein
LAIDKTVQKDIVDGIRYLRERKGNKVISGVEQMVNAVEINNSDEETEKEESDDSDLETEDETDEDTDMTSEIIEDDDWSEQASEVLSVYRYPYDLSRLRLSSPLKAMITIQDKSVEAVFDTGAAVSVIGSGLANSLGLVPNGDVIPLTGFGSKKEITYSKIVMDVPLCLGGKLRPDHMAVLEGNSNLCLIGIPFFQSFGISLDIEKAIIRIPTSQGEVLLQGYTRHFINNKEDGQVMPVIDTKVKKKEVKLVNTTSECYNVSLGDSQTDEYFDEFIPPNGEKDESIKFDETNIAQGAPMPLVELLEEYKHIFSEVSGIGRVKNYQMDIELTPDARPIKSKAYRMDWTDQELLQTSLQELIDIDVIEPSEGRYASPCFFIPKKDGTKRLVMDYRRLNQQVVQDFYPIPNVLELMDYVSESKVFSSMDCVNGYFQLELNPAHREYTSFITPLGTFRYKVLPFGITLGPAVFSRMMHTILKDYIGKFIVIFLDDILCFSKNMEEHKDHLRLVFEACSRWNLRLKRKKSEFGKTEVEYLGHILGANGVKPCERNINKIRELMPPRNVEEIRAMLGLTGYYRRFVPNYGHYAEPLTKLTKKNATFVWDPEQQKAFDYFKQVLTSAPILSIASKNMIQVVSVDASTKALSCVLSQVSDTTTMENETVIAYASKVLRGPELNYAITELEAYAVVWGVSHFKHYLQGRRFLLISDHAALTYIFRPKKTTPKLSRWSACLLNFDFEIRYRKGSKNPADALSRLFTQSDLNKMKGK